MRVLRAFLALAMGFLAFLCVFAAEGADTQPPICNSIFGWVVPCGSAWPAIAFGVAVGWITWVSLGWMTASRRDRPPS